MPKLSDEVMQQKRRNILDAAIRQFEKEGFGAASVDAICAEAGISKGAFYSHFDSKESVMLALITQRGADYDDIRASSLDELETSFFDLMLRGLSYVDSRLEMEAVTIGASNTVIRNALMQNTDRFLRGLVAAIEKLRAAGKIEMVPSITPHEAADLLLTYALGRLALQIYEPEGRDREARRGLAITVGGLMRACA